MKRLTIVLIVLTILSCKKRPKYSFPIGEKKQEIRDDNKKLPFAKFGKIAYGDTIDSYLLPNQQSVYYYKNDICYRETQTFPLNYEMVIQQTFDRFYKKIKPNLWIDSLNSRITLTEDKKRNNFSYDVVSNN